MRWKRQIEEELEQDGDGTHSSDDDEEQDMTLMRLTTKIESLMMIYKEIKTLGMRIWSN
jgi:hypothetical protein